MTAAVFFSRRTLKRWAVVSALLLQIGCTTPPPTPESVDSSVTSAATAALHKGNDSATDAEPTPALPKSAAAPAEAHKSRLADFISRRLLRHPAPAPAAEPLVADDPVDEKYRLTGEAALELERGKASWYGAQFHGRATASGEAYDKYALTAAHKTLPFGTIVRVRSVKLGREVDVRINDRGPFVAGRVIDVSQAAAEALGLVGAGVLEVSLNVGEDTVQEVLDSVRPLPSRNSRAAGAAKVFRSAKTSKARKPGKASMPAHPPRVSRR